MNSKEVILKRQGQWNVEESTRSNSSDPYHAMVGKNICLELLWGKTKHDGLMLCFLNNFIFFSI